MFTTDDLGQSSTFRELKAIYYVLLSFVEHLKHKRVKIFTDNQSAARIVSVGSSKVHLQSLALSIFRFVFHTVLLWKLSGFQDVLSSGIWLEAASLSDSSLSDMVPGLINLQLDAKAPSTVLKYKSGWLRWREWALSKIGVPVIPAKPLHIALFISELAKRSSENNIGVSSIESAVYAIKWGHAMAGFEACPVSHPLVKFALEGAKRRLARPVQPKEPLSVSTVQAIATHFASSASLSDLLGFAGFFRIDEIRNIALRDVSIHSDHMSVYLPQRKNDQYREGHTAFLARTGKVTCPVAVTERLIKLLPQSSSALPLVRRIVKAKSKEYFHCSLGVSVSTFREEFKKHIRPFVSDISKYGTHSMKSGAASNPACRKIAGDLLDIHAGWRCESTKHRYIKHDLSERLAVSKELSI
ncbi:unnamed protein product [Porites lobata]|uniref:Tyr recombinase domain-containing protein n=1 Tax=Porites lobata TaxID=104759 RepID=A0ABN8MVS5_9CNID|nr:unnamed protein product [Porites lobata]